MSLAPVTDTAAVSAAKVLLGYHQQQLATTILDIIAEYHQRMIELLTEDIEQIPARTRARERVEAMYADREDE